MLIPLNSFKFQFSASQDKTGQISRNLASTDSDNFEAVILSAHSYVFKIMIVNKKKPHPLVFVGGIKDNVLNAMSNELFYTTE